jgi:hypothetical protein
MDQEDISRIIWMDFAALDMQNTSLAANEMKDFIAMLARPPPSEVENQIAQFNKQIVIQSARCGETQ